jgi:hypothetical protein
MCYIYKGSSGCSLKWGNVGFHHDKISYLTCPCWGSFKTHLVLNIIQGLDVYVFLYFRYYGAEAGFVVNVLLDGFVVYNVYVMLCCE